MTQHGRSRREHYVIPPVAPSANPPPLRSGPEIGISTHIFLRIKWNRCVAPGKWRKVCSIFFNQISVNVTYTQRRTYLLIMLASPKAHAKRKQQKMKPHQEATGPGKHCWYAGVHMLLWVYSGYSEDGALCSH